MTHWTLADAPDDLTDKIYVITGTSSGIGTVIAHELARRGAKVVAGKLAHDAELRAKMWAYCDASTGAVWT